MESKKTFGGYVKAKRTEAGLTQKEFADILYVTESAVSKWERGLSYPDITLIIEICRVLNVSEHELLTASEDIKTRNQEKLANKYLTLIKRFKIVQYVLYGIPIIACFIVNLAVSGRLSWFSIVLASEIVAASLTLLPIFLEKRRGVITLGIFTASLLALLGVCCIYTGGNWFFVTAISVIFGLSAVFLPFVLRDTRLPSPFNGNKTLIYFTVNTLLLFGLLLITDIYTGGGWFVSIALPITAFCLALPWGIMLIVRYARINRLFKTAGSLGLSSVFWLFYRGIIDKVLGEPYKFGLHFNFGDFGNPDYINGNIDAVIFFVLIVLAVIFAGAGVIRKSKESVK